MIKVMFKSRKLSLVFLSVTFLYLNLYLFSIQNLIFTSHQENSVLIIPDPLIKMLKMRSAFLWEPVMALNLRIGLSLFISPLNILLGLVLGGLIGLNIMMYIYSLSLPKQCRMDQEHSGFLGIIPSFLTGFACCVPTFLMPLVATFGSITPWIISMRNYFIPLSILLLAYSLYHNGKLIKSMA